MYSFGNFSQRSNESDQKARTGRGLPEQLRRHPPSMFSTCDKISEGQLARVFYLKTPKIAAKSCQNMMQKKGSFWTHLGVVLGSLLGPLGRPNRAKIGPRGPKIPPRGAKIAPRPAMTIIFMRKSAFEKKTWKKLGETTISAPAPADSKSSQDGLKFGQDGPRSLQDGSKTSPGRS